MENDTLINYLKLYRHDVMNNLQLIHGYGQLGNLEKLNVRLDDMLQAYQAEQSLFKLNMNQFSLFILFFNHNYKTMQLSYEIASEHVSLAEEDQAIYEQSKQLVELYEDEAKQFMYNWMLDVKYCDTKEQVEFIFRLNKESLTAGLYEREVDNLELSFPVVVKETDGAVEYRFSVPQKK